MTATRILAATAALAAAATLTAAGPAGADAPQPAAVGHISVAENTGDAGGTTTVTRTEGVATRTVDVPDSDALGTAADNVALATAVTIDTGLPNQTVFANLTAVDTRTGGYTTAWPCDQAKPLASVNNYVAGTHATPNFAAVKTDATGKACVYTSGQAELLWDQYGGSTAVASHTAVRAFDTRDAASNPGAAKLAAGTVRTLHTASPGATIMGNLTVTAPDGSGHTTAYPCADGRPTASVNNFVAGQTTPNFTAVKADTNGDVCFYTTTTTHLLFDQVGEVPAGTVTAHPAQRLIDTRLSPRRTPVAGGTYTVVSTGQPNTTVMGNLTVTEPVGGGFTTVWNCAGPRPTASVNNFAAGQTTPNFAAVRTDASGNFCVYTSATAHLLWDEAAESAQVAAGNPTRLLDTRDWGGGANGGDDSHWSALVTRAGVPVRWKPCAAAINVYVNPANSGGAQLANVRAAIDKVRAATGLPVAYAGTTTTMPTTTNKQGLDEHNDGKSIVVAFGRNGIDTDLVNSPAVGVGGFYYSYAGGVAETPGYATYGYVAISDAFAQAADPATAIAVYMHELGHVVGLGHYTDTRQVMNPAIYNVTDLWGRGDLHGLSAVGKAAGCGN